MKETLEEAANEYAKYNWDTQANIEDHFICGAEWVKERMYTEEDMFDCWKASSTANISDESSRLHFQVWFKQFKKK